MDARLEVDRGCGISVDTTNKNVAARSIITSARLQIITFRNLVFD